VTMLISPAPFASTDPGLEFGNTSVAPYSPSRPHRGKDWKWRTSDVTRSRRVVAPVGGKVTSVFGSGAFNEGWGNRVEITVPTTGVKVVSALNHLLTGSIAVKVGQTVKAGDYIGQMGATGETGGAVHLHEELWLNEDRVDPDIYRKKHLPGTPSSAGRPIEEDDMAMTPTERTALIEDIGAEVRRRILADPIDAAKPLLSGRKFGPMTVAEHLREGQRYDAATLESAVATERELAETKAVVVAQEAVLKALAAANGSKLTLAEIRKVVREAVSGIKFEVSAVTVDV
jgi:hypothetical protein